MWTDFTGFLSEVLEAFFYGVVSRLVIVGETEDFLALYEMFIEK